MAKNKNNKMNAAQNNQQLNTEFAEDFNQTNAAGKNANKASQKAQK
ncbi:hypothetical protein ACFO9Q_02425 [Paenibacillus sp. GCM10023252]